jgi:FkbM family methyltransferase
MVNQIFIFLQNFKHSKGKKYYSETGEDVLLDEVFDSQIGTYLDIGSGHPVIGSNTYYFYKRGWTGVCVDPQPNLKIAYKLIRFKDKFLPQVVSKGKKVAYFKFANSLLSTTNIKVAKYHQSRGLKYTRLELECISIKNLLPPGIASTENFFVSIDVEGSELEILEGINFSKQRPRAIIIESWVRPWSSKSKINELFKRANYELISYTGLSALYVPIEVMNKSMKLRQELGNI